MGDFVHIERLPEGGSQALAVLHEIFRGPGVYYVAPAGAAADLLKARVPDRPKNPFEAWFYDRLLEEARKDFAGAQLTMWRVLEEYLRARNLTAPSALDWWELQRLLFDLSRMSTAEIVGLDVPDDVRRRLAAFGWTKQETVAFPAVAYRMGIIYDRLREAKKATWSEILTMARAHPLLPRDVAAIEHVRRRAGNYLRPIFDQAGQVWTAEREISSVRRIAERAIRMRKGPLEAARELAATQRAEGILRDAERVMRTELADARAHGTWSQKSAKWSEGEKIFRLTSATPCKVCLRLYKTPDGIPRLYSRAEVEAADAEGPNRGPQSEWKPKIGTTHPSCVCGPYQTWIPQLQTVFERRARQFAQMGAELGVWKEAA